MSGGHGQVLGHPQPDRARLHLRRGRVAALGAAGLIVAVGVLVLGAAALTGGPRALAQASVAPQIDSGPSFSVEEGTAAVATLVATDDDTDAVGLEWSIAGGADQSHFTLTEAGELSFTAAKDFENPDDSEPDGVYEVSVSVTDGTDSDTAALTVTVTNVIELTTMTGGVPVLLSSLSRRLLSNSGRGARDRVGGCGRIGGMQGTEKPDRELLDALGLCGALVREGSVYRFLAEHRLRLFGDGLFADLFGGRGRPSVPGSVIAVVMVLQALEGCSDREAVERLRCDVRWKAAAGLGIDDEGFDASVLTLWRQRLRASERPERIFDAVREVAAECGALSKRTRRALDSTVLYDAVATQDTVTMIGAQIRRVRRLAPQAAAVALGHDYDGRAKPVCDWGDPDERAWLIDDLVTDAQRVLDALDGSELSDEQAQAAALLAVVAGQDVEADPKVPGRWRIARRVAKGRVISTVDPEARHARKSRSQRRDGYKAHICAEPDTGLITAAELTTADTSDARVGPRLLQQDPTAPHNTADTVDTTADTTDTTADTTTDTTADTTADNTADTVDTTADTDTADTADAEGFVGLVLADSAYASGEALDAFAAAGYDTAIKPINPKPLIAGGFTRDDFTIDTDAQTVTCPAGHTKAVKSGAARFGASCSSCPLRPRCTTSAAGRSVTVDAYHHRRQANKTRWARPATQALYRRHRPMAERSIAWLTRNKARRVPYRGVAANHLWLTTRAAAVNLVRLTNLGVTHNNGAFTL